MTTPASSGGLAGRNLIFLVSQPRAGSTLLQRILGGHPAIHTTSEPWLMLEVCELLKPRESRQAYEAGGWARLARDEFLKGAGGRDALVAGVRELAATVYGRALAPSGKSYFLDKTPRYYHILSELAEIFPDARFVILLRNPLAVLCSIVRTWVQNHHTRMPTYRDDLLLAPSLLDRGILTLGKRVHFVRYEELISDPASRVGALCAWLGLPFVDDMLRYGEAAGTAFAFGDPAGIHRHEAADADHRERWRQDLRDPRLWCWARDYLSEMEASVPGLLGYAAADLHNALQAMRPPMWRRWTCPSLRRVLAAPPTAKPPK